MPSSTSFLRTKRYMASMLNCTTPIFAEARPQRGSAGPSEDALTVRSWWGGASHEDGSVPQQIFMGRSHAPPCGRGQQHCDGWGTSRSETLQSRWSTSLYPRRKVHADCLAETAFESVLRAFFESRGGGIRTLLPHAARDSHAALLQCLGLPSGAVPRERFIDALLLGAHLCTRGRQGRHERRSRRCCAWRSSCWSVSDCQPNVAPRSVGWW